MMKDWLKCFIIKNDDLKFSPSFYQLQISDI